MASIPIVVCGKGGAITTPFSQALLPDIDVIHVCDNVASALSETPQLLRGSAITPSSGLGSNISRPQSERRFSVAIVVGGAFTEEEWQQLRSGDGIKRVPWLKADNSRILPGGAPPNPSYSFTAAKRVRKCFKEHGIVGRIGDPRIEDGEGEVWDW